MSTWASTLDSFIRQSQTSNLKTANYIKNWRELQVKVSFGMGFPARVPWVAFITPSMQVSNGYYPVYLYYKDLNTLILAYGVSETEKFSRTWPAEITSSSTVQSYFNTPIPRYGDSFVFKVYKISFDADRVTYTYTDRNVIASEADIENDLETILDYYKHLVSTEVVKPESTNLKRYWVISSPKTNWEIAKSNRIWATSEKSVATKLHRGDHFILYVKDNITFMTIFEIDGDWYQAPSIIWSDETESTGIKYPFQVKVKLVIEGQAGLANVVNRLQFIENKEKRGIYLRGSIGNFGRPITESDYKIIYDEMIKNQTIETNPLNPVYSLENFQQDTGISMQEINDMKLILERKKQIILQGPPGTGKTFIAERLARHLVSETKGEWKIVQFHSAYTYEDFIQGYKPELVNTTLSFQLKSGNFKAFCDQARGSQDPFVLIIDEINRGNLAKIFGELMYLLEYRNKKIPLAAGGEFMIPEKVYIIGTMNTADRSIALVDHALRRRFSFIRLQPKYNILKKYLDQYNLPSADLIDALNEINSAIKDQNYFVGISFFMKDGADLKKLLPIIWRSEIEPYLEEYFYDDSKKAEVFTWEQLKTTKLSSWA